MLDGLKLSDWPRVGFSGTRKGMTFDQVVMFGRFMRMARVPGELHHGDCIGSDAQAHIAALALDWRVVVHPPLNQRVQAFSVGHETRAPLDYIERNHAIVDDTECLIATPDSMQEVVGSGTWATIRYARKLQKRTLILWPDGSILLWTPDGVMGKGGEVL